MELAPVPPPHMEELRKTGPIRQKDSRKIIVWHPDGTVVMYILAERTTKTWYAKPTLGNAVAYRGKGSSFQFHKDGAVTAWCWNEPYYWSAPTPVAPQFGFFEIFRDGLWVQEPPPPCCYDSDDAAYESAYYYRSGVDRT